jgi:hypothetical protein
LSAEKEEETRVRLIGKIARGQLEQLFFLNGKETCCIVSEGTLLIFDFV